MMPSAFSALSLPPALLEALESLGYSEMLPVQAQALPVMLAGRDVVVRSDTGSGKTVAFGLALLAPLEPRLDLQALAICPTRELAEQVATELRRLARRTPNVKVLTLCGGVPFAPQRASLAQGAHVIVGTPGRLEEHARKGNLRLEHLKVLVLDEADRMLDMGFEPQIARVLEFVPAERQTLLFSATYPDSISSLSQKYQRAAEHIDVAPSAAPPLDATSGVPNEASAPLVEQRFFRVPAAERKTAVCNWLALAQPESALVFCNTRSESDELAEQLRAHGWVAASIHGEISQRERQHALRLFANGSCSILAATDVAARGWDIPHLPLVINLGLSRDPTVHLHRIGRTGRLGRAGLVVSFVSEEDEHALQNIERRLGLRATFQPLPPSSSTLPPAPAPPRVTLLLGAGKNKKLRPGDILGALTGEGGIEGKDVGAIQIDDTAAYVAIGRASAERALSRLQAAGVKGRSVKVRRAGLQLREQGAAGMGETLPEELDRLHFPVRGALRRDRGR
ncbi:MAG TPA: ATP-dependent RNA helicase DbpA [Polyangiaceae bacterium]|nr:ATP-dependent RNA helicase DbpA [Polyangiaceae bacterium]